jgi:nucleoid DNA-binding protein
MNKAELVNEIALVVNTRKEAEQAVDCLLKSITTALAKGDSVTIAGFGTFKVSRRNARIGKNPRTGRESNIEARNVPRFVPGKAFKEMVDDSNGDANAFNLSDDGRVFPLLQ